MPNTTNNNAIMLVRVASKKILKGVSIRSAMD
jgi:hypothetical protein